MIEELFVFLALAGAVIASITDIRSRIIPNRLTFTLIAVGVFGYLTYGLLTGDLSLFLISLKSVGVMFIAGYLLWTLGLLPAADVKGLMFIAALIPTYPAFLYGTFNPTIAYYPFIITVFINTFISLFPFLFLYSMCIALKKRLASRFIGPLKNPEKYLEQSFVFVAAISASKFAGLWILTIGALFLLYRIPRKYRILLSAIVIFAYVSPLSELWHPRSVSVSTYFVSMLLLIITSNLIRNSINVLRKEALRDEVKITDLEEGAIIAEEIYIQDGEILRDSRGMIEKIKDAARTGSYQALLHRKKIANTHSAGVIKKEIGLLKEYVKNGKLENKVMTKKSMPFAPGLLIGLIVSLVIGDAMLALQMWLYG